MNDEYKLNPCKCGSKIEPDLDSDSMVPCWMARCFDCKQFHHGNNWTMAGAVKIWNKENPISNTTRFGNDVIVINTIGPFHKPNKKQYTTILEFEVVKPQHLSETVGEPLILSMFGEYCPDASLRGYSLEELLMKPENYRPKVIVQMGETIIFNHG